MFGDRHIYVLLYAFFTCKYASLCFIYVFFFFCKLNKDICENKL